MWQIFNKLITTLSQTLHRIFQQVSTSFNKMNEYRFSFTAYSTTFIHIHFNKSWYNSLSILQQHTSSTIYISFLNISSSYLQQTFNELLQSILRNILRNILHNKLVMYYFNKHSTNIFEKRPSKLFITNISTNYMIHFFINYSSQTFQQTIWYISTSQTFTIGELVIELHHIFIMIKWQVFNNIFKWLFTTFIQQTLTTIYDTIVHYIYFNELQ